MQPTQSADPVASPPTAAAANAGGPEGAVSPQERARFHRVFADQGYFVFENVVPKEPLSSLSRQVFESFHEVQRSGGLFDGGGLISGHLNFYPGEAARFAFEALQRRGIVDLAKELIPAARCSLRLGGNLNLPKSVAQHYHEDYSPYPEGFVIVNVAVVDTDLVNGAIDVVPGTHRKAYPYWRFAIERPHRHHVRLPMKQGDVLVRISSLWHRGMPNRAVVPRPMLAFTFGEDVRPGDPFQFDEGKVTFSPNWYRPNLLGRLRERTFVAAPITYSAYRFVKSLLSTKRLPA